MKDRYLLLKIVVFISILFLSIPVQSQQQDSVTPFRAKRWLLNLNGSIRSSRIIYDNNNQNITNNSYSISLSSSYFLVDRFSAGIRFSIGRDQSSELFTSESELAALGPFFRYYTAKDSPGSLYLQMGYFYGKYNERREVDLPGNTLIENLEGNAHIMQTGIGYSHAFRDFVVLEFGLNYNFQWLQGFIDSGNPDEREKTNLRTSGIEFGFGINVLFRK